MKAPQKNVVQIAEVVVVYKITSVSPGYGILLRTVANAFHFLIGRFDDENDYQEFPFNEKVETVELAIAKCDRISDKVLIGAIEAGFRADKMRVDVRTGDVKAVASKLELAGLHLIGFCSCGAR